MTTAARGRAGESEAAKYLEKRGYQLVARNFRTRRNEIDIVAMVESTVVFVEVKSWRAFGEQELGHSIDGRKKRSIVQGARAFLRDHPEFTEYRVRFDVMLHRPGVGVVRHDQNAFMENG